MGIGGLPTKNFVEEKAPNKIQVAFQNVLEQKTFYPLYPGHELMPLEVEQATSLMFKSRPDVLISPSDLKLCIESIEGSLCINPGYLVKGVSGGNYAMITIDPLS
jgi:DNA polymerase alpha subunit B